MLNSLGNSIVKCGGCGLLRVMTIAKDYEDIYKTDEGYHGEAARRLAINFRGTIGDSDVARMSYYDRYKHDYKVASVRWNRYFFKNGPAVFGNNALDIPFEHDFCLLDFGCANGAFMTFAKDFGANNVFGVDINKKLNVWASIVSECKIETCVSLHDVYFNMVTMHDVIEHLVDPVETLRGIKAKMNDGVIIIDTPDAGAWENVNYDPAWHHYKPNEHIWYFTEQSLIEVARLAGFYDCKLIDKPIPGKLVGYFTL